MTTLAIIILATALSGLLSAAFAVLVLLLPADLRTRSLPHLVSFATGALLGVSLLALLPHAIEGAGEGGAHGVGLALVGGLLLFFVLEKFVLWRHCHGEHHDDPHEQAAAWLVLTGDALHNALDGVLIAAAFLTDRQLGIATAIAVAAHEIPQEVGDFAVLLNAGWSRARALWCNFATSLTAVVGGVAAWFSLQPVLGLLPWVLAVAAASLLYVAVADLIPGLHRRSDLRSSLMQSALIGAGVLIIALIERSAH
ncbi:MAG TPA: ZIP family metal transporter [Steroidobacteraceae bacterium]|nr:ZIP family metal transporter [Steroidobacteraceae bacterium]HQW10141.1 ZIP family metal transporter [Steroidobacteraceae bacterium]HQX79588.1 ZIP family metal transporter [Steroidobacteraceae bacterium]HQZ81382.1 ZIP family metal transporter [Steroidobacteraceae bacterium]